MYGIRVLSWIAFKLIVFFKVSFFSVVMSGVRVLV